MSRFSKNKKIIIICVAVVLVLAGVFGRRLFPKFKNVTTVFEASKEKPKIITDEIIIPKIDKITGTEGVFVNKGEGVPVLLAPNSKGESIVVVDAVLTVKGSFNLAQKSALVWASDAKLVFIKTLGTVMLDGKSSYWQIGFGSLNKKSGYEIVIKGDTIVSSTEVSTISYGFDLPQNWYDSGDAIDSIRTLPQFREASVSQINFFYNNDAKWWSYSVITSVGSSIMSVK